MAATTRAATPPEPFPPLDAPRTPTSLSGGSNVPSTNDGAENPNLLRPRSSRKSPSTTADISPKSDRPGFSPLRTPIPLTGQAAMADLKRRKQQEATEGAARQTSPNPAVEAMQSLIGGGGMSKVSDAPAPNMLSEPLRRAAEKINIPETTQSESLQASPVSMASFGTIESTGANSAMTATASTSGPQYVAEPAQMTEGGSYTSHNGNLAVAGEDASKAFSYPGPPQLVQNQESGPSRGMSYPGIQGSPKSPASNKRHKCPYCATDFTRHHNLKSHLLTHSQEKPYVCQTCQSRFRRLHDLKRHTKLHTGERPHTCDKCGRRFARGDALARHNKGPGGCAGRRSSFGGDDDDMGADGAMDGVEYTGGDDEDEPESDQQSRRLSEPSRKRAHVETPQDTNRQVYRQHSSTYPPVGPAGRPHGSSTSSMGPPQVIHPGSSTATSPREMSGQPSPAAGSSLNSSLHLPSYPPPGQVFQQQGMMTESPKPISPGQPSDQHRLSVDASMSGQLRNRSPSLTTQFQQQHFGRGSAGRTPPQPPGQFMSAQLAPHGPVLPPLPAGQPHGRPGIQPSMPGPGPSLLQHQQVPPPSGPGSNPGSLSSHGRSSGSSMRDVVGQDPGDIWGYVRSLEQRFSRMQDEYELRISRLQEEVISLKGQMSQAASYSSDMGQRPY
ncbi:hypothetical protein LTR36_009658 [Oleoguttula mirabilis]|uniref:C2H2-type domain-containing protein n=1 Tax=Oleoguttula mirabilis TaxID=1507867 RepID=A0AAV9J768_9PEZI|nr:hypothetical protein LTR36_009658 [Oleoguttula mirabilis]